MKKLIIKKQMADVIGLDALKPTDIIVGISKDRITTAVVRYEPYGTHITRINPTSGMSGVSGHHITLRGCVERDSEYYDFYVIGIEDFPEQ